MNPPPGLNNAMNRERKPFTYTPGGLDLSEIKSERMAKRLMRNAMNQGVSETPAHLIKSPPASGIPIAIPNFNCLPVQVFPTFQLPANPKSLLRTRSSPGGPRDSLSQPADNSHQNSDNPKNNVDTSVSNNFTNLSNKEIVKSNVDSVSNVTANNFYTLPKINNGNITNANLLSAQMNCNTYNYESMNEFPVNNSTITRNINNGLGLDFSENTNNNLLMEQCIEGNAGYTSKTENKTAHENKQEEVNVIETNIKGSNNIECQNGDTETAVVVKLPTKKSAAKTETKVEVVQNILPDGTVQEVKTTTTKTTKDGKTEIATKTETRTLLKDEADEETYDEEEEEEYEEEEEEIEEKNEQKLETDDNNRIENKVDTQANKIDIDTSKNIESEIDETSEIQNVKENGRIVMHEEKIETSTTKKVVVQSEILDSEEEIEELEEELDDQVDVEKVVIIKEQNESETIKAENQTNIDNVIDEERDNHQSDAESETEEEIIKENDKDKETKFVNTINQDEQDKEVENEISKDDEIDDSNNNDINVSEENEINEEIQDDTSNENLKVKMESEVNVKENNDQDEEEFELAEDKEKCTDEKTIINNLEVTEIKSCKDRLEENKTTIKTEENIIPIKVEGNANRIENNEQDEKSQCRPDIKDAFSEPSIPLEKVEEVEIKPICTPAQEIITKSHKEIITTTTDKPSGALSTQTEYNVIENIVTVNRTTKTLDHAYEQAGEYIIPVVKTSLIPDNSSYLPVSQPPTRPYETSYSKEPETERRHSLLLERLSVERQLPPSVHYSDSTYNTHMYEDKQFSSEPQSEVLTESNVKPSMINKNQQWYAKKDSFNNLTSTDTVPSHQWVPTQTQNHPSNQYQTNIHTSQDYSQSNTYTTQNHSQSNINTTHDYSQNIVQKPQEQSQYNINTPQNQHYNHTINHQTFSQRQQTPQPQIQSGFSETITKDTLKSSMDSYNRNSYPSYTPKPSWVSSTVDPKPTLHSQPNKYSYLNNESDIYQKSTQNQTSYVPPPWEQDTGYNFDSVNQSTYYQPQQNLPTQTSKPTSTWKPTTNKHTKTTPTSYIPPAPNQSFVKPVSAVDQPNLAGRKTYYSEYERRYITVPESTYIPTETKFQAQPDPSPKYYYDQQEVLEPVEPQWRKELREFTEKTQISTQTTETSVRPPWEQVSTYIPYVETSNTPNWSQTLRPRTCREQSVESEYTATTKEWQKTNTLGRGRPQSSYLKNNLERIPERARGVSVDRYNPNCYQPPLSAEHPPVQSQTLDPAIHPKPHYRPNVSAYPSRASAEPREQPVNNQANRVWVESRTPPIQSRSFKYLQWITGTED